MDSTNRSPRRFGGMMMTDQRGADEAVMLMRLTPSEEERFSLDYYSCLIIGALHMFRGPKGLLFDITSTPEVMDASGKPLSLMAPGQVPDSMREALERIRGRLRSRTSDGQGALPPAIVDQLRFFVFEKGDAPVTLDWRLRYAGKTYPLQQPAQPR